MASSSFSDQSIPGGVVHNPASQYSREMAKWEMDYSPYGPPGRRRDVVGFQEYPAMFYKMRRSDTNGDFLVVDYREAADEVAARHLRSQGYHLGQTAAIEAIKAQEQEFAVLAANRPVHERRMSKRAQAEAAAADAATGAHVPSVPVTPIRKRGRPVKVKPAAVEA